MKYTLEQYNAIIDDVNTTIACASKDQKEFFHCVKSECTFCPFATPTFKCPDCMAGSRGLPIEKWPTARTTEGWRKWLDYFMDENDPTRPLNVIIPREDAQHINTALNLMMTAYPELTERLGFVQRQINEQIRG